VPSLLALLVQTRFIGTKVQKTDSEGSDEHIYTHVMAGDKDNTFVSDRIEVALRDGNRLAGLPSLLSSSVANSTATASQASLPSSPVA